MKLHVRFLVAFVLAAAVGFVLSTQALAQTDPLSAWNDGPAKQATGKREEGGGWNDQVKKPDWNSCGNDGDGGAAGTGGKKRGQSNVSPTSSSRDSSYNIRPPKQTTTNINTNASNKASTDDKVRKNLKDFVAKYEKDMWLAAASRHYDTTGQRISAEMAKAMIEGGRGKGTGKG